MEYYHNNNSSRRNLWGYLLVGAVGALIGAVIMVIALRVFYPVQEPPTAQGQEPDVEAQPEAPIVLPPSSGAGYSDIIVAAAQQVRPSVVGITNYQRQQSFFGSSGIVPYSSGSGVVIDAQDGYIVTNNHVVDNAAAVSVTLGDGSEVDAEIVGTDSYSDLAVLKIDPQGLDLKAIAWGDSDQVQVGELAIAIGNPLGLQFKQTVTSGIISATDREVIVNDSIFTYLQTDAAINQGNSGGALVNSTGQLIGINSAKIGGEGVEGMGFAIPSNTVRSVVDELIQYGIVRRPWMGIYIQDDINPLKAQYYGLSVEYGVLVGDVEQGAPADQAGITAGDVIIAINGERVENHYQLQKELYRYQVGATIQVTLQREENTLSVDLTLEEIPVNLQS